MPKKLKIKVLSVGGRGANILERMKFLDKKGIERLAIGVNSKVFDRLSAKKKIVLKKDESKVDVQDAVEQSIEAKRVEIEKALKNTDTLFIIGNLANETSHLQVAMIAEIAKQNDTLTFFVGSTPFPFEGKAKIDLTRLNKEYIGDYVDAVLMLESEKVMSGDISAMEAITKVDTHLADMITSIVDLVAKFGVINVDFADLKSTIESAGEIFFNSVLGSKDEIDSMVNDLFEKNELDTQKKKLYRILYVIYAGKDVLMEEIGHIGQKLQGHFDSQARVIFGVVNEEKMKNKFKIVLMGV